MFIIDGMASREQPMVWETTTAGTVRMSVYDDMYTDAEATINAYDTGEEYDEHTIYFVYEGWQHEWVDYWKEKCGTRRILNWVAPRELKP